MATPGDDKLPELVEQTDPKRFRHEKTFAEKCTGLPLLATWINTTPHDVVLYDNEKEVARIKANPLFAIRLKEFVHDATNNHLADGLIPVIPAPLFIALDGKMPPADVPMVVSMPVAQHMREKLPDRKWVFTPDSGPASVVRDVKGAILGVKRLNMWQ